MMKCGDWIKIESGGFFASCDGKLGLVIRRTNFAKFPFEVYIPFINDTLVLHTDEVVALTLDTSANKRYNQRNSDQKNPKGEKMQTTTTKSSVIKNINYMATDRQLKISFKSGQTYTYFNVPKNLYERFLKAKSKGRFFTQNIQKSFPYRQGKSNKMVVPVKEYTYKANGRKITVPAHTRVVKL